MSKNIIASFNTETPEGKIKVFNAMNGSAISLKNVGSSEILEIVDVLQYNDTVDSYGSDQEATITVLFDANGTAYAGVSDTVAQAAKNLIPMLSDGGGFESINIAIVKQKSGRGQEFINLRAVL